MPAKKGFQLTEGDIELLGFVYQHRLVTIDHLVALTGRHWKAIYRRLPKLVERKFIQRRRDSSTEKYIYAIGKVGRRELVECEILPEQGLDPLIPLNERSRYTLEHALMVTNVDVCFEVASRKSPIKLIDRKHEGKAIYDKVTIWEDGRQKKLSVRPDKYLMLQDTRREGRNRAAFFVEVELQRLNKRFGEKIKGFWQYYHQGLQTKRYGIKGFGVIIIATTEERVFNRCETARRILPKEIWKYYFFGLIEDFSLENPERIFDKVFMSPQSLIVVRDKGKEKTEDTGKRYSLIPPLPSSG